MLFGFIKSSFQSLNSIVTNRDSCSHTMFASPFHNAFEDRVVAGRFKPQGFRTYSLKAIVE